MDKKKYEHPMTHPKSYDYMRDIHELEDHIHRIMKEGYHKGHLQHLGGAASFHVHLTDLHYGYENVVKKELKRVLMYLYMYADTCHDIYCFFAEDAYEYVECLYEDIRDPYEKEHVKCFMDCVKEYMEWLKSDMSSKTPADSTVRL